MGYLSQCREEMWKVLTRCLTTSVPFATQISSCYQTLETLNNEASLLAWASGLPVTDPSCSLEGTLECTVAVHDQRQLSQLLRKDANALAYS